VKKILTLLIGLLLAMATFAQAYPNHPIKLIIPFPPAGAADGLARMLAEHMQKRLGQPIVLENRAGASSIIGTDAVAKSSPDGYTLLINADGIGNYSHLYSKLPFDFFRDLVPIAFVAEAPMVLASNTSVPANNLLELIALAKKEPGKLVYANAAVGSTHHLAFELFARQAGVEVMQVSYRGAGPAMQDVMAGHAQLGMFTLGGAVLQQIKAGKLRPYAVFTPTRSAVAPDIPTVKEAGLADVQASLRFVLMAPRGTPTEIIQKIHATAMESLKDPDLLARLQKQAYDPLITSPEATDRIMRQEHERWGPIIKAANIKLD